VLDAAPMPVASGDGWARTPQRLELSALTALTRLELRGYHTFFIRLIPDEPGAMQGANRLCRAA